MSGFDLRGRLFFVLAWSTGGSFELSKARDDSQETKYIKEKLDDPVDFDI